MADLVSHPDEVRIVSRRFGLGATNIDRYLELDGYQAVQKALSMGADGIVNEVKNPTFTYDPALLKDAKPGTSKTDVAPGPNNPVGNVWLGLSKPHWGIHGTPNPERLGRAETNGCVHLTNWDAQRLSTLAKPGFVVDVRD